MMAKLQPNIKENKSKFCTGPNLDEESSVSCSMSDRENEMGKTNNATNIEFATANQLSSVKFDFKTPLL